MRKIKIFPVLLMFCLAAAGCGGGNTASSSAPEVQEASASAESGTEAAVPEREKGIFLLAEHEDLTVEFLEFLDPDSLAVVDCLRFTSPVRENTTVTVSDIVINGQYALGQDCTYWEDTGRNLVTLDTGDLQVFGGPEPKTERVIRCHLTEERMNEDWSEAETLWESDAEVALPADFTPEILLTGEKGVQAKEQVLLEKDGLRVTLNMLGTPPEGYWNDALYCFLKAENHSRTTIPFRAGGISLNGAFFVSGGSAYQLEPGEECYTDFYISSSDIEESGITGASDVSLLLLTDEKDSSMFGSSAGGSWYPVTLSVKGEAKEAPVIENLLFENEYIQVGFTGLGEFDSTFGEEQNRYYEWYLLVKNISDTNVHLDRVTEEGSADWWVSGSDIGAGSWRYVTVNTMTTQEDSRPALTVSFRGISSAGGLLFEKTEPITLPAE